MAGVGHGGRSQADPEQAADSNLLRGLLWLSLIIGVLVAAPREIRSRLLLFAAEVWVPVLGGLAESCEASLGAAWRPDWLLFVKAGLLRHRAPPLRLVPQVGAGGSATVAVGPERIVSERLVARIAGSVCYIGNPLVESTVTGSGRVARLRQALTWTGSVTVMSAAQAVHAGVGRRSGNKRPGIVCCRVVGIR
ncbi:MAG: hypothetical protein ACE5F1_01280 [Planctomycetota bacterium]